MGRPKFIKETRYEYLVRTIREHSGDGCLLWPFDKGPKGHGLLHLPPPSYKKVLTHREAYKIINGCYPEPCGRHTCDVALCYWPAHIIPGTILENNADMLARGRHRNQYTGPIPQPVKARYGGTEIIPHTIYDWMLEALRKHKLRDGCLHWPFTVNAAGYPRLRDDTGKKWIATRLVYKIVHDYVPEAVTQSCNNHDCISPFHLYASTITECSIKAAKAGGPQRRGERSGKAKLSEVEVKELRRLYSEEQYSQMKLAKKFGIHQTTVSSIINRKIWVYS